MRDLIGIDRVQTEDDGIRFHKDGSIPLGDEIFVYGSNDGGLHGAGAAGVAYRRYGAIWGVGHGLKGRSYGIATKDTSFKTLPFEKIEENIMDFVTFTRTHPELRFFVTRVGCGLAKLKDERVAPLFMQAKNCSFAREWAVFL